MSDPAAAATARTSGFWQSGNVSFGSNFALGSRPESGRRHQVRQKAVDADTLEDKPSHPLPIIAWPPRLVSTPAAFNCLMIALNVRG